MRAPTGSSPSSYLSMTNLPHPHPGAEPRLTLVAFGGSTGLRSHGTHLHALSTYCRQSPSWATGRGEPGSGQGQGQLSRSDIASQRDHFSAIGDKAKKLRGRRRESDEPGRCQGSRRRWTEILRRALWETKCEVSSGTLRSRGHCSRTRFPERGRGQGAAGPTLAGTIKPQTGEPKARGQEPKARTEHLPPAPSRGKLCVREATPQSAPSVHTDHQEVLPAPTKIPAVPP